MSLYCYGIAKESMDTLNEFFSYVQRFVLK